LTTAWKRPSQKFVSSRQRDDTAGTIAPCDRKQSKRIESKQFTQHEDVHASVQGVIEINFKHARKSLLTTIPIAAVRLTFTGRINLAATPCC
jgi:hypothetical protein